ncbi:MAG TPA: outer membrane beta-barrel protein [Vicinamibacterales bacterium]
MKKCLVTAAVVLTASTVAPRSARADWVLTPFVGWNFGSSADVSGNGGLSTTNRFAHKVDYGVSAAYMGHGIFGAEADLGYSPSFYSNTTKTGFQFASGSNVTTLTGNLIVGIPVGGEHSASIRPYGVAGVGLIRSNVGDVAGLFNVSSKNDFGFDVGGGVMGFVHQNVGIRGDVRYFRGFKGAPAGSATGLALGNFQFWRASAGVSFKF